MLNSTGNRTKSQQPLAERKKLKKNPFKSVVPAKKSLSAGQSTLSFMSMKKANSTLGEDNPLKAVPSSSLNRSSSTPNIFTTAKAKSSSLSQIQGGSFENDFDDDLDFIKEKPLNLKNSKPIGSFIPHISRSSDKTLSTTKSDITSSQKSVNSMITPPRSVDRTQALSQNEDLPIPKRDPSQNLNLAREETKTPTGGIADSSQSKLNFGNKQLAPRRRLSPWDTTIVSSKKMKNPRLKETKSLSSGSNPYAFSPSKIKLSEEQNNVVDLVVNEGKNVFYTGSAGTGKSILLKELVSRLTMKYGVSAVAVTASTGLAAVNIGGVTINKFSGMGIAMGDAMSIAKRIGRNSQTVERWKRTKVLIVDEISMIDGSFLDKLEFVARQMTKKVEEPFGGIQVVLTGDFFQLPPVATRDGPPPQFCFQAQCWGRCIQRTILLKQVFRQKDNDFVELLNCLRLGEITDEMSKSFQELSREVRYEDGIQPTELFCTRNEVDNANNRRLQQLPGQTRIFDAKDIGDQFSIKTLESVMAVKRLVLKEDAQVMMIKNVDETLVNGTVGKVVTFLTDILYIQIKMRFKDYEMTDDETIHQMRLISKCISETELPDEVLQYAQTARDKVGFVELATAALKENTSRLAPVIKFTTVNGPRLEIVQREEFLPDRQSETGAQRMQFPLLLSWALSIHKSQGQTLDRVKVDLSRVFEMGQVYVALSRAVSKDRLQIVNFRREKIQSSGVVKKFYQQLDTL